MVRFISAALIALTVSTTAAAPAFAGQHHGKGGAHISGGHGKHGSFGGLGGMKGISGVIGLLDVLAR